MRVARLFSDFGLAVIAAGLLMATLAGAEPATDGIRDIAASAKTAVDAVSPNPEPVQSAATIDHPTAGASPAGSEGPQPAATSTTAAAPDQPPAAPEDAPKIIPGSSALKPAKALFGAVTLPSHQTARAIGGYAKGCLAGAQALPTDGPAWQVMRLSRNRNWGHPKLVAMIERLAADVKAKDGWSGLLVGDLSQPRGGPMVSGHASHQIGLDADVWLTPMPDHILTAKERETMGAGSVLSDDGLTVAREKWTDAHTALIKRAASYHEVERVLVHPAIKQVLCYAAKDDRGWLTKVRPYWGHDEHIHIRISCPPGSADCKSQPAVPGDEGCGKEIDDWLRRLENLKPEPAPIPIPPSAGAKPQPASKEKAALTLVDLPDACRPVLAQDNPNAAKEIADAVRVETGAAAKVASASAKAAAATHHKTASAAALGGPVSAPATSPATTPAKTTSGDASKAANQQSKKQ